MLAPADADLVRRDGVLPGLALLLDPDGFVDALRSSLPEVSIETAEITYLRYKPRTSCLVGYLLTVSGTPVEVYAKALLPTARDRLGAARERPNRPGALGPGRIVLEQPAVVVSVFPNDDALQSLAHLADPQARGYLLRNLLPGRPDLWDGSLRNLRYKPQRRYVGQLLAEDGTPAVVLKAYCEQDYQAAQGNAKAFSDLQPLHVAVRLGRSNRHRILALEWLHGRSLNEVIAGPAPAFEAVRAVGTAVARLHAHSPKRLVRLTREAEAATLLAVAADLIVICPPLAERANGIARRLAACLAQAPSVSIPIHGDFYAKQVVLSEGGVAILDLDQSKWGDPASDLGLFAAHLERDGLHNGLPPNSVAPLIDALLQGYRDVTGGSVPSRVDLYVAVGLLRLAPEPFRYRNPEWPEQTEALLRRAEAILGRNQTVSLPSYPEAQTGTAGTAGAASKPGRDRSPRVGTGADQLGSRPQGGVPRLAASRQQEQAGVLSVPVGDKSGVACDPEMPFLARALDPEEARRQFERHLQHLLGDAGRLRLCMIRVIRHKPGRRCLMEYDVEVERPSACRETITLVGKVRARGLDLGIYRLMESLWNAGFGANSGDGVSVPEPVGVIPEFQMWLQRKVPGVTATRLLPGPDGVALARRIAVAIHKVHRAGIPAHRRHTMADELRILHERLPLVVHTRPLWAKRIERLLGACDQVGAAVPAPRALGIHRDFYADQVIVDGARLYLLDFDLYCEGDPALDIGNFLGHITEQSLRTRGDPNAMADREEGLEEEFAHLAGEATRSAVRAYATLTLARHIYLSTQLPNRQHCTEALLELCEQRLGNRSR